MLLEVLSDFQISIPELGVIEARTRPLVLLTSNNSRELTEALKRRCLYLWLDYPSVDRELEIVRLHAPELDEGLARRLVEIVHMVRQLDLKKPPSIAESIDWARTLLLIGADDIDRETFEQSMSIIVKHRSDIDLVAERVAVKLGDATRRPRPREPLGMSRPSGRPPPAGSPGRRQPARLLRGPALRGRRGRHLGDPRRLLGSGRGVLDRPARLPRGARLDDRQVPGGPPGVRPALRPPLLPRGRGRGAGARDPGAALRGLATASTSTSCARRSARRSRRATTARCATWPGWRSPPSAAAASARA